MRTFFNNIRKRFFYNLLKNLNNTKFEEYKINKIILLWLLLSFINKQTFDNAQLSILTHNKRIFIPTNHLLSL